eukprot:TRINITY_DN27501_c0_g1_i1.p1 TRINITY_DN27501_c0_g1~~TRINITY_DN27501_c0_g1_i1.p1  ORF type:complete len:535 (+),score=173.62 TRINITY_DN27501_c0_g1_i1:189-1793(+)
MGCGTSASWDHGSSFSDEPSGSGATLILPESRASSIRIESVDLSPEAQRAAALVPAAAEPPPSKKAKFVNNYKLMHTLGRGMFGKVKLAIDVNTEHRVAIKILNKRHLRRKAGDDSLDDIQIEVAVMKKLDHPNVLKLYEVLNDPDSDKFYLVLELAEKGEVMGSHDMRTEVQCLSIEHAWSRFRDLIAGMSYVHFQNIVHRDIKPANLLLSDEDRLKICDFGVSQFIESGRQEIVNDSKGSPAFFAPEVSCNKLCAGKPLDVWAAGVTLYFLVFGTMPFKGKTLYLLFENIRSQPLSYPREVDPQLKDILELLLHKQPEHRPAFDAIKEHPWVTKNGTMPMEGPHEHVWVSEQEVKNAIAPVRSFSTVLKVGAKLKNKRKQRLDSAKNSVPSLPVGPPAATAPDVMIVQETAAGRLYRLSDRHHVSMSPLLAMRAFMSAVGQTHHRAGIASSPSLDATQPAPATTSTPPTARRAAESAGASAAAAPASPLKTQQHAHETADGADVAKQCATPGDGTAQPTDNAPPDSARLMSV